MPRIRLILQEREGISLSMSRDISMRQLARQLGLDPATVSREVRAGGGRSATVPSESQRLPVGAGGGLRCEKLAEGTPLRAQVCAGMARGWSPQQVAARIRLEHPSDGTMHVSFEPQPASLLLRRWRAQPRRSSATSAVRAASAPHSRSGGSTIAPAAARCDVLEKALAAVTSERSRAGGGARTRDPYLGNKGVRFRPNLNSKPSLSPPAHPHFTNPDLDESAVGDRLGTR